MPKKTKKQLIEQWNNLQRKTMHAIIMKEPLEILLEAYKREHFQGKGEKNGKEYTYECQRLIFTDGQDAYSILTSSEKLIANFDFCKENDLRFYMEQYKVGKRKYWRFVIDWSDLK